MENNTLKRVTRAPQTTQTRKYNAKHVKITNKIYKFIIKLTINKLVIIKFYFTYINEKVSVSEY